MSMGPKEVALELVPQARYDVIDVVARIKERFGDVFNGYRKTVYCSLHTTAGYLEQSFCMRLQNSRAQVDPFIRAFQKLFPPDANYRHDQIQLRQELSDEQKKCEPRNADSHLTFISSGLKNCVTYVNRPGRPVYFIDLDGTFENVHRTRQTNAILYDTEDIVHHAKIPVPVSKHQIDSVNLKDPRNGFFGLINELLKKLDISKGRIDLALDSNESHAGLTVNEWETLLMRYDLAEVLRNPLKFMAMQGRSMLLDPKAIPSKTIDYAKYDFVHIFNELMDAFRVSESVVEKILSTFISLPASRFLRMKRSASLLVSDNGDGQAKIVQGTYQSPILVQWKRAEQQVRYIDVTIHRFR